MTNEKFPTAKGKIMESVEATSTSEPALVVTTSNFETRRVQVVNSDTLRVRPSVSSLLFSLLFTVLGLALVGFWTASTFTSFEGPGSIPLLLIGVLFVATGLWLYHASNEQLIINRETGVVYIRSWRPVVPLDTTSVFKQIHPRDIVAIETISRVVKHRSNRSRRSSQYTQYQVNLCTVADERHNVYVTLKPKRAENLANQLTQIFSVPLRSQSLA